MFYRNEHHPQCSKSKSRQADLKVTFVKHTLRYSHGKAVPLISCGDEFKPVGDANDVFRILQ